VAARVARIDWASHRRTVRTGTAAAVARGRAADGAAARAFHAAVAPVRTVDWEGLGGSVRSRSGSALGRGRELTAAALDRAQATRRSLAAQQQQQQHHPQPGRANALRLNEQAAALRQEGRLQEALEAGERALAIFRVLGDRHGQALTLNGLGLTQARLGDEPGALDSYEAAVALLTDLGDSHGAGRVLANLGALHRIQGDDEQARAVWHDALERLEPGTPEHDRTAEQLRLAS
jgi:tetratricopeptide (TPR) repeat protein